MAKQQMRHLRAHRPSPPPKKPSLAARATRYLCGFMALMALFTLLSRAADEMTIPRVRLATATEGYIERTITGYGTVEALSARPVTTQPGIRVAGIAVKSGSRVEAGEPLFTLDTADLQEKLTAAQEALARQDMDLEDQDSREDLAAEDRARAIERANQDYAAAKSSADRDVERAVKALDQARTKLSAASPPTGDLEVLEAECARTAAELQSAEDELAQLEALPPVEGEGTGPGPEGEDTEWSAAEPSPEHPGQSELDEARMKAEGARTAKEQADGALAAYMDGAAQYQLLQDSVESAQDSYERAVEARDSVLRSASRQIEDAARPQARDSSREKARMDRDRQARQVELLEQLSDGGGIVRAPVGGTVAGINITVGFPTTDGTALLISGEGNGRVFTAQLSSEQEKYVSPGDKAVIKPGGGRKDISELAVETVARSATQGLLDVTVSLPEGVLEVGAAAQLEILRKSKFYQCQVPLTALHEENGSHFLLVVREKAGILGAELTAARLDVEVIEKNETYAAIQPGALARRQGFLDYTSKPVSAGDRIRLEAQ